MGEDGAILTYQKAFYEISSVRISIFRNGVVHFLDSFHDQVVGRSREGIFSKEIKVQTRTRRPQVRSTRR